MGIVLLCGIGAAVDSCKHIDPLVVSGDTLNVAGQTFIATSKAMDAALQLKAVTPEQYAKWSTFKPTFQASFDLAVQLWKSAREANDSILQGHAEAVIQQLLSELAIYSDLVLKLSATVDGGAL